jgi:hypothetical protein
LLNTGLAVGLWRETRVGTPMAIGPIIDPRPVIGLITVPTPTMALPTAIMEDRTATTALAWAGGALASASGLASKLKR